jgi:hypothetical protein
MVLGSGIRYPGSGKNLFRIPDPGVKKHPIPDPHHWKNYLKVFMLCLLYIGIFSLYAVKVNGGLEIPAMMRKTLLRQETESHGVGVH